MKDVADRLGLSIATVSRALSGKPGISETTRARVVAEAEAMAYVVSSTASALVTGRTGKVTIAVPWVDVWFYSTVLAGAESVLRERGMEVTVRCLPTVQERFRFIEGLPASRSCHGLIVVSFPIDERSRRRLGSMGLPVVSVGARYSGVPFVGIDDRRVAAQAVGHLLRCGHRRIGLIRTIDPESASWSADIGREAGYHSALADAGIESDPELTATAPWGIEGGARAMEELLSLDVPPTAVFCFSDEVAIGALRTLRRSGIEVPEAISVLAVDDHPMAELVDLTTVAQPVRRQGEIAAQMIMDLLAGGSVQDVVVPTTLIARHTTAPPRSAPASPIGQSG